MKIKHAVDERGYPGGTASHHEEEFEVLLEEDNYYIVRANNLGWEHPKCGNEKVWFINK